MLGQTIRLVGEAVQIGKVLFEPLQLGNLRLQSPKLLFRSREAVDRLTERSQLIARFLGGTRFIQLLHRVGHVLLGDVRGAIGQCGGDAVVSQLRRELLQSLDDLRLLSFEFVELLAFVRVLLLERLLLSLSVQGREFLLGGSQIVSQAFDSVLNRLLLHGDLRVERRSDGRLDHQRARLGPRFLRLRYEAIVHGAEAIRHRLSWLQREVGEINREFV